MDIGSKGRREIQNDPEADKWGPEPGSGAIHQEQRLESDGGEEGSGLAVPDVRNSQAKTTQMISQC